MYHNALSIKGTQFCMLVIHALCHMDAMEGVSFLIWFLKTK
uniref:Uncharacterized protein n=1 Tax=Arundo donax TaxID=35708 RepID=A0A0A8ZCG2_ARUDO